MYLNVFQSNKIYRVWKPFNKKEKDVLWIVMRDGDFGGASDVDVKVVVVRRDTQKVVLACHPLLYDENR